MATGFGVVPGAIIAGVSNIPNTIVDGYQFGRDVYRGINDGWTENGTSALLNGAELTLDWFPVKALKYLNKAKTATVAPVKTYTTAEKKVRTTYGKVGTGAGRMMVINSAKQKTKYNATRNKAIKEATNILFKRGVRPIQGSYFNKKFIEEMANRGFGISTNDAIRSSQNTVRQNQAISNILSGINNTRHIINLK